MMVLTKKMTLLKRVVFWLLAISCVTLFMLAFIGLEIRDTIRDNGLNRVQSILAHKFEKIDSYLHQRHTAMESLRQLLSFSSRHHRVFSEEFWRHPPEIFVEELSGFAAQNGFYDLFIISMEGDVIYSVKKEEDLHTNLVRGKYRDTELAKVVARAFKNAKPYISDFTYYAPSRDYAAFIAAPVYGAEGMIGIVAAQIDNKTIQSVIADYSELGRTGEIIASVRRHGKSLTMAPIRNSQIKSFEKVELDRMAAVISSAEGGNGRAYMKDRLGHNAAVVWGYLDDLRWGIVITVDENELLHVWQQQAASMLLFFLLGVGVVAGMIVIAFRSFSQPIEKLTQYAVMVSRGEYDLPIKSEKYDREWQLLIHAFQQMAEDIKDKMDQLNEQNRLLGTQKGEIEELNRKLETKIKIKTKKLKEYVNVIDQYVIASQTDRNGTITYASDAFCRISGYSKEELVGQNHRIIRHPDMPNEFFEELWGTISRGDIWHGEIKNKKADGGYYWVDTTISPDIEEGKIIGYTAVRYDITDKKRIEELVITDSMTGLYNRRHYVKVIEEEMNRAIRHGTTLALMMLDVDYFKRYNDTYGHQAGDNVLSRVADVLKSYTSRSGDYAFRMGGEEFSVIVTDMNPQEYLNLGELICRKVESMAIAHANSEAAPHVTVSIGIALYRPESGISCEELYKAADMQLYRAKAEGRNRATME